jgi:16S rRNA (cytidine1402-2'-O)-methyltransferase
LHKQSEEAKDATLYVVATPIGNLRDITLRALDILRSANVVVAEDKRVASKLLTHYGIDVRVISSHEHNERQSSAGIVKLLAEGKSVALTTDAGTPAISDPGSEVVARAGEHGFRVVPIPGASALSAALSVCGERLSRVMFCGFLPAKDGERHKAIEELATGQATLVFYEAPHRILKTVDDLAVTLGPQRRVVLCRELTKLYEEVHACALGEARMWLESKPERIRGEFVLVVTGAEAEAQPDMKESERVLALLMSQLPLKQAVSLASEITHGRKNTLYRRALDLARDDAAE